MNRWYWRTIVAVVAAGVVVIIVLLLLPKSPIPGKVKSQLTSTLFVPHRNGIVVNRASAKYDRSLKVLSYNVTAFGKTISISEQPTPDQFTDVPQVYQKVLDGMNDYDDFDVNVGSVHLTTPPQLNGKQAAVLNAKGTLLFAKPSGTLTGDQWRQFFTSLEVVQ